MVEPKKKQQSSQSVESFVLYFLIAILLANDMTLASDNQ